MVEAGVPVARPALRVTVLGPVRIEDPAHRLREPPGVLAKSLIVALTLARGFTLSVPRLIEELWDQDRDPPRNERAALQTLVSRLRASSARGILESNAGRYALVVSSDQTDLGRASSHLDAARTMLRSADPSAAAGEARAALDLWNGEPGADLGDRPLAEDLAVRAESVRRELVRIHATALVEGGDPERALEVIDPLVAAVPLDEELQYQRLRALSFAGRRNDALRAFADYRSRLRDELGTSPGGRLVRMNADLLRDETGTTAARTPGIEISPAPERAPGPGPYPDAASVPAPGPLPSHSDAVPRPWPVPAATRESNPAASHAVGPESEPAANPSPDLAANPALGRTAAPVPDSVTSPTRGTANPAPDDVPNPAPGTANPAPDDVPNPAPGTASPAPDRVTSPAPDRVTSPAPSTATTLPPDRTMAPGPGTAPSPAPGPGTAPSPAPGPGTAPSPAPGTTNQAPGVITNPASGAVSSAPGVAATPESIQAATPGPSPAANPAAGPAAPGHAATPGPGHAASPGTSPAANPPAGPAANPPAGPAAPGGVRIGVRVAPNALVGRDDDVSRLAEAVATSRLTTVLGPGGIGKTRLAHEVASRAAATTPSVIVVELASVRSAEDVTLAFASTLGIREIRGTRVQAGEPGGRIDVRTRILSALSEVGTLLVVDNCEHLVDAAASWISDILDSTANVHILATSRAPLSIGAEQVYQLEPLRSAPEARGDGSQEERRDARVGDAQAASTRADSGRGRNTDVAARAQVYGPAVDLFIQRARAARPSVILPLDTIARLCDRLDGLPLAIELAAARTRSMSVDEIERRLGNRFALLTGGERNAPERHRTLHAVIDWSWNLLSRSEQRLLRRLARFPDGFSADAAGALAGDETDAVLDDLDALVSQSLVSVIEDRRTGILRYRILETVREFGDLQLAEAGEEGLVRERMFAWAVAYCRDAVARFDGPGQAAGLRSFASEQDNLLMILRDALDAERPDVIVNVFGSLGYFWTLRSSHSEVVAFASAIARATRDYDPEPADVLPTVSSYALLSITLIYLDLRAVARILASLRRIRATHRIEDGRLRTVADLLLSRDVRAGRLDDLQAAAEDPDPHVSSVANLALGALYENAGEPDRALEATRRAYELGRQTDEIWAQASAAQGFAQLYSQLARPEEALEWAARARAGFEELEAAGDIHQLDWMIAMNAVTVGDHERARRILERFAGEEDRALGIDYMDLRAIGYCGLAEIALAEGRAKGAEAAAARVAVAAGAGTEAGAAGARTEAGAAAAGADAAGAAGAGAGAAGPEAGAADLEAGAAGAGAKATPVTGAAADPDAAIGAGAAEAAAARTAEGLRLYRQATEVFDRGSENPPPWSVIVLAAYIVAGIRAAAEAATDSVAAEAVVVAAETVGVAAEAAGAEVAGNRPIGTEGTGAAADRPVAGVNSPEATGNRAAAGTEGTGAGVQLPPRDTDELARRMVSRLSALSGGRIGFIDRPVLATGTLAIAAWVLLGRGADEVRGIDHVALGAELLALAGRLASRQDMPSLHRAPIEQLARERHGDRAIDEAHRRVNALTTLDDATSLTFALLRTVAGG